MQTILYNMLSILCANYYNNQNIFVANQNKFIVPKNGQFIIITEMDTVSFGYPQTTFTGALPSGSTVSNSIDGTKFQLDFYGPNAKVCCSGTRLYVRSNDGTNWLQAQNPPLSAYTIEEMMNLTSPLDQDQYLQRYAFRFTLFNNSIINYNNYGFNTLSPNLIHQP